MFPLRLFWQCSWSEVLVSNLKEKEPALVRWLKVILRLDRYRVEESMKFDTKNLVGIRNKFSLGATRFDDRGGGGRHVISILDKLH